MGHIHCRIIFHAQPIANADPSQPLLMLFLITASGVQSLWIADQLHHNGICADTTNGKVCVLQTTLLDGPRSGNVAHHVRAVINITVCWFLFVCVCLSLLVVFLNSVTCCVRVW